MKNKLLSKKKIKHLHFLSVFISLLFILWIPIFAVIYNNKIQEFLREYTPHNQSKFTSNKLSPPTDIEAKSYYVLDINNHKVIASKNEYEILPLASLTKIVTTDTYLNKYHNLSKIDLNKLDGDLDYGLNQGQINTDYALKYMNVISSNDIAESLANNLGYQDFINNMNKRVKEINPNSTLYFNNSSGLDVDVKNNINGGVGNVKDITEFVLRAYRDHPEYYSDTASSKVNIEATSGIEEVIPNTNNNASYWLGLNMCKTGYTDLALGNLVCIFDIGLGRQVAIGVLGSSKEGRFDDMRKLYDYAISVGK